MKSTSKNNPFATLSFAENIVLHGAVTTRIEQIGKLLEAFSNKELKTMYRSDLVRLNIFKKQLEAAYNNNLS